MRSPKDMRTIQIDITNACVNQCSNCTRFCGHYKQNYFMEWPIFKQAVDSLSDFPRCVGMMGGEPTLHPQFARFACYLKEKHPSRYALNDAHKPIKSFARYIHDRNYILDEGLNQRHGPGLWTSITEQYYRHYELIQEVFGFQNINDHQNPSLHQPLLISRKDLGISDEQWPEIRDKCWFQNTWSASITPKGAFFCEIAGALDMLFDGPGGWKIEKGWWQREPKDFGDQLQWCEICGGALFQQGRLATDGIDDVSPSLYERLKAVDSPKLRQGKVEIIGSQPQNTQWQAMPATKNRYLTDAEARVSPENKVLYPRFIEAISITRESEHVPIMKERITASGFDGAVIYDATAKELWQMTDGVWQANAQTDDITFDKLIGAARQDWLWFLADGEVSVEEMRHLIRRLKQVVLNPGVLYQDKLSKDSALFNPLASSYQKIKEDKLPIFNAFDLAKAWQENKKVQLEDDFDALKNPDLEQWQKFVDELNIEDKEILNHILWKIESDYAISAR